MQHIGVTCTTKDVLSQDFVSSSLHIPLWETLLAEVNKQVSPVDSLILLLKVHSAHNECDTVHYVVGNRVTESTVLHHYYISFDLNELQQED